MSRFRFLDTPLAGLQCVDRLRLEDHRGFLSRLFCADEFAAAGFALSVAQINHTLTRSAGAVRGMHYQLPPFAEMKLVTCVRGRVDDGDTRALAYETVGVERTVHVDLRIHRPGHRDGAAQRRFPRC